MLLQLYRAGLAEFVDLKLNPPEPGNNDDDPEELARVRLHFHPETRQLGTLIAPVRAAERARFDRGFDQLNGLIDGRRCVSRVLADLYDINPSERVCGGCPVCRARKREPDPCPPLSYDAAPIGSHRGELVINWPDPLVNTDYENFLNDVHVAMIKKRVRRFLIPMPHFERTLTLLRRALPSNSMERYRIDPFDHTTIVATPPEETLVFLHLGVIPQHAFALARDRYAVHLCTRGTPTLDADGRGVHVREKCTLYHSPEAWFFA